MIDAGWLKIEDWRLMADDWWLMIDDCLIIDDWWLKIDDSWLKTEDWPLAAASLIDELKRSLLILESLFILTAWAQTKGLK